MNKRKKFVAILAGVMAAIMVLTLILSLIPHAMAASSSEIRNQINDLKTQQSEIQQQIEDVKKQYQENEDEIANIVEKKKVVDQEIGLLYQQIAVINEQLRGFNLLIADKQDELDAANARLNELNEKNKERIRVMEEEGTLSYWAVLFKASSFADLLDRLNMIQEIAAADRRRLAELSKAADEVAEAKNALALEKADLDETRKELDATQEELSGKQKEAENLILELLEKGEELENLEEQFHLDEEALLAEIAQKEQEYNEARQEEIDAYWAAYWATYVPPTTTAPPTTAPTTEPTTAPTEGGGNTDTTPEASETTEVTEATQPTEAPTEPTQNTTPAVESWGMPCSYIKLTSPYGNRTPPTAGASSFHQGVDLAGNRGTPIYAARSGKVTRAGYSGSGGHNVTINHMDGFSSAYLHMTHYVVSVGQTVSKGQVIGYMGDSGISTGVHLHFAIYYNGASVNPANYIYFY